MREIDLSIMGGKSRCDVGPRRTATHHDDLLILEFFSSVTQTATAEHYELIGLLVQKKS